MTGEVSRINQYGNQSHCIKHSVLRKFCFCKDQLEADHRADPKDHQGVKNSSLDHPTEKPQGTEESRVDETRATTRQMDRTGNDLHTTKPFDDDHRQDGHKQHEGLQTTEGSSEEYRTSGRKDETTKRQGEEATTKEVERTEDKKENSDKGERWIEEEEKRRNRGENEEDIAKTRVEKNEKKLGMGEQEKKW